MSKITARYDAARTNIEQERYWANADNLSPNAANDRDVRQRLRSRSRYECQESNSFARGMLLAKTNDVIGVGPSLQVTTPNRDLNRVVEQRWAEWWNAIRGPCKLRVFYEARACDGEAFMERVFNPRILGPVQLDLSLTEADLWTDPFWDGSQINNVDGILFDDVGNPLRYTRLLQHPGDSVFMGNGTDTVEVDADNVIHWYRCSRPDQRRGIPDFTPALPLFAELRRYRLAVISAAEIAADISAVMYSTAPAYGEQPDEVEAFGEVPLERRAILTLPAGWQVSQLQAEQPTTQFGEFTDQILKEVGRSVQMPLNIVSGSSRDYNFASGRLDYLLYWNACDVERHECDAVVMNKVFDWWFAEANSIPGYIPTSANTPITKRWVYPPRRPIDEVKAAQAAEIRWNMGHLTDAEWALNEQVDLEQYYEQLQGTIERRQEIGAPLPGGGSNEQEPQTTEPAASDLPTD